MAEILSIQEVFNFKDGSQQIIDRYPFKLPPDPPVDPPDPDPTLKATLETHLNVRETPHGTLVQRAGLQKGEVIQVSTTYSDLAGWRWRKIEGEHKYAGNWAAETALDAPGVPDYQRRYMSIASIDYGDGTDPGLVQPKLFPIQEVSDGIQKNYWLSINGQTRQHMGADGRKFAVLTRAPELVKNGTTRQDLLEQLHKMNYRPIVEGDEPLQFTLVRSYAFHENLTLEENIAAWREYLEILNGMTVEFEGQTHHLIHVICVLHDGLGDSHMIFPSSRTYHTGEHGHLQPQFWHDEAAIQAYIDTVTEFIRHALAGYEHLVPIIELFNEVQLHNHYKHDGQWAKQPVDYDDAMKYREVSYRLSKAVFEAGGGKHAISLGTRMMSDVTPQGFAEIDWIRQFFTDPRANYLHALTCHIHPYKNATSPTQTWEQQASAMNAIWVARETGRVFYFGEIWTWFPAEDVPHGAGWGRVEQAEWFCHTMFIEENVWAMLVHPLQFLTFDKGFGNTKGGLDYTNDPVGTPNVGGVYHRYAGNILWQRRKQ